MNRRSNLRGFSIVELVVVVLVIGILATAVTISYNLVQSGARDYERESKVAVITDALEKYYDENGEYPSCEALTSDLETAVATLNGLPADTLVTPTEQDEIVNSIQCSELDTNNPDDKFAYVGDGSPSCLGSESCLFWTLQYKNESSSEVVSIDSRNRASIANSGAPVLSVVDAGFSQISLSWTAVPNASGYVIQRASNSSFSGAVSSEVTNTSGSVTGLNQDTLYYFRVAPKSGDSTGVWSNITNATTLNLQEPTISVAPDSGSQITVSWSTITNATSYTLQYTTTGSFTSPTTITGITGTSRAVTGLSIGPLYSFRLKALSTGGVESTWSNVVSSVTQVPAPTCSTTTKISNTQISATWGAVSGATYSLQYADNGSFSGATNISDISTTNRNITGLLNGKTYHVRVKAHIAGSESSWDTCPTVATGVDGPSSYGWSSQPYAVRARAGLPWMPGADPGYGSTFWTNGMYIYGSCAPGATVVTRLYQYYAYSNNTVPNNSSLMDWTWGNQDRYVVSGSGSWWVWWQGWVACQVGSTRVGDVYLGNAGPY